MLGGVEGAGAPKQVDGTPHFTESWSLPHVGRAGPPASRAAEGRWELTACDGGARKMFEKCVCGGGVRG